MIVVHHLGVSQSERIVWLCEELGLDYELRRTERDPRTRLAPDAYRALHPMGTAPVMDDTAAGPDGDRTVRLAESGAIVEYLLARHGGGRLALAPDHPDYPRYVYWMHAANGTLQPMLMRLITVERAIGDAHDHPMVAGSQARFDRVLRAMESDLSEQPYLGGATFTAADIMASFTLTTMRRFRELDLAAYPAIRAWIERITARPAYARAMARAEPVAA